MLSVFYSILLPFLGLFFIGWVFISGIKGENFLNWLEEGKTFMYVLIFMLLSAIPAIYIFLEYTFFNCKRILEIEDDYVFWLKDGKLDFEDSFDNISTCVLYKETKGWEFFPVSNFSFAEIKFKNGKKLFITCLFEWDLRVLLERTNYIEKRCIFPSILLHKLIRRLNDF